MKYEDEIPNHKVNKLQARGVSPRKAKKRVMGQMKKKGKRRR